MIRDGLSLRPAEAVSFVFDWMPLADQNPSYRMPHIHPATTKKENLSIVSVSQLPAFHCDDPCPMGFPDLAMHRCGGAPGLPICHRVHARRLERDRAYRSPSDFFPVQRSHD